MCMYIYIYISIYLSLSISLSLSQMKFEYITGATCSRGLNTDKNFILKKNLIETRKNNWTDL